MAFWREKTLAEMTDAEWESLCDGCGRCCLVLLEDDKAGEVWETDIACKLFDASWRRCTDYKNRRAKVPDCVRLTPDNAGALPWMPETCAYRRLAEGHDLPDWHPLLTGDRESVVRAGIAVPPGLVAEPRVPERRLWDHAVRVRMKR